MEPKSTARRILRWTAIILGVLLLLVFVLFLVVFRGALYKRFVAFPREAAAWNTIRNHIAPVVLPYHVPWTEYRGIVHSHSELSHDSEVPFETILQVMKEVDCDFIALSDHCLENGTADYGAQWRGMRDGKLFIPGFEMNGGFMPWGLESDVVLDCGKALPELAAEIEQKGGLLFIAHPEEPRMWELPQIKGMEIYNLHADLKDEDYKALAPDLLLNLWAWPEQTYRLIFDRNTDVLANWDKLNLTRDITGVAANDCHQNNGIYGIYTAEGKLILRKTSGDEIGQYDLNFLTRSLLRLFAGPLEPGKEAFRIQVDPYQLMARYVNTHILAKELSEAAVLEAFEEGRCFIGFDMIADSSSFRFLARRGTEQVVMGERMQLLPDTFLVAAAPHPCRFALLRNGEVVHQEEAVSIRYQPDRPGKYRVEAELNIQGEWVPWIYSNPIELTQEATAEAPASPPPAIQ